MLISLSASVMSGSHAGVQTLMRQNYMPRGVYIHCFTHRLNLVISDECIVVSYVDEFMGVLSKLHQYFTSSSVNNECFRRAQLSLQLSNVFKELIGILCLLLSISFHC